MKIFCLILLFALAYAKHEQYQGWKSFSITTPSKEAQANFIALAEAYQVDVLSYPIIQRAGLVVVNPVFQEGFLQALETYGIEYSMDCADLKKAFDEDDVMIAEQKNATMARNGGRLPYDNYQELDVIYAYLEEVAALHPDIVTLVTPANSYEGRPIKYVKISTTNFEDESKPVIFIDGGIHSREWIAVPPVTYAIQRLIDGTEPDMLEKFDWVLLPVVNPDGYVYSFTNDRMWRMTRSRDQHMWSNSCPGVDGNRNYDFFWNTVGVSSFPCGAQTYPGATAFSEIETRVVRDIMWEHLHRMEMYLTMHSYGSMILYPWGHDGSLSSQAFLLQIVGNAMAQTIDAHKLSTFPNYIVGNGKLLLNYGASGAAEDYAHSIGVPASFTYELPGRSGFTTHGFLLPARYVEQVSRETWEGIVAGARRVYDLLA